MWLYGRLTSKIKGKSCFKFAYTPKITQTDNHANWLMTDKNFGG